MKTIILLMTSLVFVFGCRSGGDIKNGGGPPDWVLKTPELEGRICSVGMSDPTFFEEDAKINAAEIARKELAKTLSMDINSIMIDFASEKGNSVDRADIMQISSWASSSVVQNAEILEYWRDTNGLVSEKKNSTYALSCMPKKIDKDALKEKLSNASQSSSINLQDKSRTADEIIKFLNEGK
ncbi:MAG: hypothetical protein HY757_09480 [Nitrospirae bacterium]|nr:hypothetical protein [Nitrospirota bacterium]